VASPSVEVERRPDRRPDRRLALAIFAVAAIAYLLTSGREPPWGDAAAQYKVAEQLYQHHAIDIGRPWPPDMKPGDDGKYYSIYPPIASLVQLPGVVLLDVIRAHAPPDAPRFYQPLTSHLACSLLGALAVMLFFQLCRQCRISRRAASTAALVVAFATTTWVYAHYSYSEIAQAAWFTGFVLWLLRVDEEPAPRAGLWLGLYAGLLFGTKYLYLVSVAGGFAWLGWRLIARRRLSPRLVGAIAATAAPFVIACLIYNAACWGSPLATRYQHVFGENLLVGLWGMMASPGKSVLLYSPPLFVTLVMLPRLWRTQRTACTAFLAAALPAFAIYASYKLDGDYAWGPRYTVFAVPVAGLGVAVAIEAVAARWHRIALAGVIALGVGVQVLGNAFYWDHFIRLSMDVRTAWLGRPDRRGAMVPVGKDGRCQACFEDVHQLEWLPPFQPILGQLWLARAQLAGDSFAEAETYAPWRRQTSLSLASRFGDDYARVRLDWWGMLWLHDVRAYRRAGEALLLLLLAAQALAIRQWWLAHQGARDPP
jgi:hypothetical protein